MDQNTHPVFSWRHGEKTAPDVYCVCSKRYKDRICHHAAECYNVADPVPIVEQKAVPKWSGSVKKSTYSSSSFDRNSDRGSDRGFNRDNKDRDFNSRSSAYGGRQNRSKGFKVGSMTFNKDGRINSDSRSDRSERRPARKARVWGPVDG